MRRSSLHDRCGAESWHANSWTDATPGSFELLATLEQREWMDRPPNLCSHAFFIGERTIRLRTAVQGQRCVCHYSPVRPPNLWPVFWNVGMIGCFDHACRSGPAGLFAMQYPICTARTTGLGMPDVLGLHANSTSPRFGVHILLPF